MSSKSDDDTYTFHPSPFSVNNITYKTSEHFIQSEKAKHYGDTKSELAILSCETALDARRLGHNITKPKEATEWNSVAKDVCATGIQEKFHQNNNLLLLLLSTNNQTLAEASQDSIWGTGIPLKDDKCLDKSEWKNIGILGEILMELRSSYQPANIDISDQNKEHHTIDLLMTNQNAMMNQNDMMNRNSRHDEPKQNTT